MGEGDLVPDKPESLENGNSELEEKTGTVMDNKEERNGEVTEMEEDTKDDGKVEADNMDVGEEIDRTEEIEETVKDGEIVKQVNNNGEEEDKDEVKQENKEDKQVVVEEGKVEIKDKIEEEVDAVEDEERSEEPKSEKGLMKKRTRTKNDIGKKDKIKKKEPVDKMQKPKSSNEKKVEEHVISTEKEDPKTPVAYTTDRPVRERKSVERLVATIEKDAAKDFHVEKGRGTALKDIPNVAYKLSKKKNDDTFRLLHNILFGRRGKAAEFKNNMSRFSGFVWQDNEEKQTIKVKEKLDKNVKEKLVEFCDVLDIPVSKANTRKEDICAKLIEFFMSPHAITTELLADKEQSSKGQKRKRVSKSASESSTPSKVSAKSSKKTESSSKKGKDIKDRPDSEDESEDKIDEAHEDEEDINGVLEKSKDEMSERAESEEKDSESEEFDEDKVKQKQGSAKSSAKKGSTGKTKTKKVTISKKVDPPPEKTPVKVSHSRSKSNKGTSAKSSSGKKKDEIVKEKISTSKKSLSSGSTGKKVLKGKEKPKEAKLTPTDDELRNAICELLKEVDFNIATFTDVLKLLAKRFSEDLTSRKSSIKLMIQEELTKLADSEDEDDEGDAEKDKKATRSLKA